MKKSFLNEIREHLLSEKRRIEEELKKTGYNDMGNKADENAAEVAQFSDNLSLESTLGKLLRDIDKALDRLDVGEYGKCKYCQKNITEERLRARPTSSSCIECKKTLTQEV